MVLEFPLLADDAILCAEKRMIFATHGHFFNENHLPLHQGDVLLYRHSHIPVCREYEAYVCLNPGSVSIPKEDGWHGYMTLCDGQFFGKIWMAPFG